MERNKQNLDKLIEEYGRLVSSVCRRMIYDEEAARDAAQEVWLEITRSLDSFRGEAKISTWIYTIAYRVVIHHAQKEKDYSLKNISDYFLKEEIDFPASCDLDKNHWIKEMCSKCLTGILHCLNSESRLAYILKDVLQISYPELVDILGKDYVSIRQMVTRSRKKLKNFLEDNCILSNPHGQCRCRMKKLVQEIDLPQEYENLQKSFGQMNIFWKSEKVMSEVNYWKQYLPGCHKPF